MPRGLAACFAGYMKDIKLVRSMMIHSVAAQFRHVLQELHMLNVAGEISDEQFMEFLESPVVVKMDETLEALKKDVVALASEV